MLSNSDFNSDDRIGDYRVTRLIGRGAFSKVYAAEHCETGQRAALKLIRKDNCKFDALNLFENEMDALMRISDHDNVLKLQDAFETDDELVIVTELCEGGDLFGCLTRRNHLKEWEVRPVMRGILEGLLHIHGKHGICHRDLKLENVLLKSDGTVVLGDFGLSKPYKSVLLTRCGSEEYAAPEVILGKPYEAEKVDVWSFGVILYTCLRGSLPFLRKPNGNTHSLYTQILNKDILIGSGGPNGVSDSCASVLKMSLARNPACRATLRQLLASDFFK
jgi:serine/threonine protein kinase